MINFKKGNIFSELENVDSIVNTINCVGAMGKGVAKEFAKRYPILLNEYKEKCKRKEIIIGKNYIYEIPQAKRTKFIINFPTKNHWRFDSKIEYIDKGLNDLVEVIEKYKLKSIAMPALGCGNGGLDWEVVKPLIVNKLSNLIDVEIIIYEPALKERQEKEPKISKSKISKPRLTKDRKILLLLMDIYNETKGNSKITYKEINALSYIMHHDNSKIEFDLKSYGPYSPSINPIITNLAKYYIKPLVKQNESDATPIEIVTLDFPQKSALLKDKDFIQTKDFLNGFELKEGLLILTIGLWMHKKYKVFGEELYTLISDWLKNNKFNYDDSVVRKAVSRIEKTFRIVDILTFDL
ncbi:macro domain-containing protein [Lysinibacillus sp. FSL H8-0500]|uniref:type II toxin-antitoxin system antitoxin DNA ADP-ribosyl glycohydrolase DarG n=1 Tax=Lysinibacillus sp. FSL H8-0500 TaxID=2921393 RepID=UPI0031010FEB